MNRLISLANSFNSDSGVCDGSITQSSSKKSTAAKSRTVAKCFAHLSSKKKLILSDSESDDPLEYEYRKNKQPRNKTKNKHAEDTIQACERSTQAIKPKYKQSNPNRLALIGQFNYL